MTDLPLHVRVAEALGWSHIGKRKGGILLPEPLLPGKGWEGWREGLLFGQRQSLPDYDTDWSATGPLIEKYGLAVCLFTPPFKHPAAPEEAARAWWPGSDGVNDSIIDCFGPTPLRAVCYLILELKKAGKL